jgi:PAS domain S-box-containing protein
LQIEIEKLKMKDSLHEIFRLAAGHFFRKYREDGGTQRRLAINLGVSQSYISSVLSGARTASLELQNQIAHILSGKDYEDFMAIGRRIRNGLDPEIHEVNETDNSVESLITRLSHYVIDHKRIEDDLVSKRNFYEKIVEGLQSGVVVSDANDNITYMNRFMESIIGVDADRIIGINQLKQCERFPDRDLDELMVYYQKAKGALEPVYYENVFVITSGGNRKLVSGWMIPMQKGERYDGMIVTIRDITRLQKVNQSLLATIEYLPHPVGLALQDYENGPVTTYYMNTAAKILFGIYEQDSNHDNIKLLMQKISAKLQNSEEWLMQTAMNLKGAEYSVMEITFRDGRKFTWESHALRDAEDAYCGRYVTIKEIKRNRLRDDKIRLVKG